MTVAKPKLRMRWRRLATIFIGAYLLYWSGVSLHHIWVIQQQERVLSSKVSSVRAQNRVLSSDIKTLNNPAKLKNMLTGEAPFPNLSSP